MNLPLLNCSAGEENPAGGIFRLWGMGVQKNGMEKRLSETEMIFSAIRRMFPEIKD
ncbi:MAG: hypothetical protein IJZ85_10415 [Lachnospiraceae bacterium]|nr:hypothetical protein [Lachnospiraceae bacterium]